MSLLLQSSRRMGSVQRPPEPEVQLFGSFSYTPGGRPLTGPGKRLLACLLLSGPKPLERSGLAETLWPEAEPDRGRFYVRRALSHLKAEIGGSLRIESDRDQLRLFAAPEAVDVLSPAIPVVPDSIPVIHFRDALSLVGAPEDEPDLAPIYEAPMLLVRPDQHVAWRGTAIDDAQRADAVIARSIGASDDPSVAALRA